MTDLLTNAERIAILWYWLEGQSTLRYLIDYWFHPSAITVLDRKEEIIDEVPSGVTVYTGDDYLETLPQYDLVFKTPGMTIQMLKMQCTHDLAELNLTSQTQLFFDLYDGMVIGVTGTKGKSTIVSLLADTLQEAWVNVVLAGNVWFPILDLIDFDSPPEVVVYELSSYMLESLNEFSLDVGVFNTLYNTHIAEHGSVEKYVSAKCRLLDNSEHILVGNQVADRLGASRNYEAVVYGDQGYYTYDDTHFLIDAKQTIAHKDMLLVGDHNKYNASWVVWVLDYLQGKWMSGLFDAFRHVIAHFKWLEHRLEPIGTYAGIERYNDAIATTPQATAAAINALGEKVDTLFYGGIEGEYDHSIVVDCIKKYKVSTLILFPDTGHHIKESLPDDYFTILETRDMEEAVAFAAKNTKPGHVALLSCGSPSFSNRINFKEKGNQFKKAVKALT